jgi:hypothetical protein
LPHKQDSEKLYGGIESLFSDRNELKNKTATLQLLPVDNWTITLQSVGYFESSSGGK